MLNKKKTALRTMMIVLTIAGMTIPHMLNASAKEETSMIAEATYTMIIDYSAESHKIPISGAEFSVAKIMREDNGRYEPVRGITVTEKQIYSHTQKVAIQAVKAIEKNGLAKKATRINIGFDGKGSVRKLERGIYLVWQTGKKGRAARYETAAPALVQLNEKNIVNIQPKTTAIKNEAVKTGDLTNIRIWAFLLATSIFIALGLIFSLLDDQRKPKKGEKES